MVYLSIAPSPVNMITIMASGFSVSVAGVLGFLFGPRTLRLLNHGKVEGEGVQAVDDPTSSDADKCKGGSAQSPPARVHQAFNIVEVVSFSTDRPSSEHQVNSVQILRSETNQGSAQVQNSVVSMDCTSSRATCDGIERMSSAKFKRIPSTLSDNRCHKDPNTDQPLSRQTSLLPISNGDAKEFFMKRSNSFPAKFDVESGEALKRFHSQVSLLLF